MRHFLLFISFFADATLTFIFTLIFFCQPPLLLSFAFAAAAIYYADDDDISLMLLFRYFSYAII